MIYFINIDEVENFNIRKYFENLSISIFPLTRRENINFVFFFTREDIEAE